MFEALAKDARLQRSDICGDIGQFRHWIQIVAVTGLAISSCIAVIQWHPCGLSDPANSSGEIQVNPVGAFPRSLRAFL